MATDLLAVANRSLIRLGAKKIVSLDEDSDRARACQSEAIPCRQETLRAHPWNFARKRARLSTYPAANLAPDANAVTVGATSTFTASAGVFLLTGQDVGCRIIGNSGVARISTVADAQHADAVIETAFADTLSIATESWRIAPAWGWDFRYSKPVDYLRLVEMQGLSIKGIGASILWTWWRDLNNAPEPVKIEDQFLVSNIGGKIDIAYTRDVDDLALWDSLATNALVALLAFQICYAVTGSLQASKTQHDAYKEALAEARTINGQEGTADDSGSDILLAVRMM